ncbi:LuxR C-terminal-related transcriptional regulator [Modestobacter marinus]|uniref:LuxR C-terminal-related transcriptional regulator n=1 Tax=Modestobacter marinus TaxID=477641 RepID=UPI001C94EBD8|nr:LuxR C-terminal-related transcriptional regulator [Modestobacter marinus]
MAASPNIPPRVPASKSVVPELPVEFTPRPRLRQLLDEAAADQVVVVTAPAGFGKTLLLADWVRDADRPETAWVKLEADDNDPRRLWSAVVSSLLALPSAARDGYLQRLAGVAALPGGVDVVEELADALDALDTPVRIVLDDVQALTGREVLQHLTRLIRRRPTGLQLVLASRADPPISIPRLRLEGRLHELRADVLRFSLDETTALLEATGLQLTPTLVASLHARTEGWAAGLRLAALALRRTDDATAFVADFSGDERSIADYLTGEILDGLGPDTQDFLRVVSVCSPLPAALAAGLSARADADRMLDELRQATALVERSSPTDYRIHALLRSYLVANLARHRPETYRDLQAAAARWWVAHDQPVHALRHAERAGDRDLIAALVHRCGLSLLLGGNLGPLQRALAAAGPEARAADPWLALTAAITHLEARALPAAATELQSARRAWPVAPSAALDALRTSAELLASTQGLADNSFPHPQPDTELVQPEVAALLHASRGAAEFGRSEGADVSLAGNELERALELAHANDLGYLEVQSLWMLATLAAVRGDLRSMAAAAAQAVAVAARRGRHPSAWSAGPMGMIAYADLLRGDPAAAVARCEEALGAGGPLPPEAAYTLHAVHGAACADLGRRPAGLAELRSARTEFGDTSVPPAILAALAVLEHRVALMTGNLGAAAEVAHWLTLRAGTTGETLLLQAWSETAAGRHQAARAIVAPVYGRSIPILLPQTMVEAQLVDAEAALQRGDEHAGRAALELALTEAETVGVVRPFAFAGPCTQELLSAQAATHGRGSFGVLVATARAAVMPVPAVPLSERELAVLALLPSLLNAREIADEFTVSVNTVKSHIRSIYAKFGVSSRREAVRHARESGLLP